MKPGHIRRTCHGRDVDRVCGECGADLGQYKDDTMEIRQRDSILWTKDEIDYGPDWESTRKFIYSRDGWECVVCGSDKEDADLHAHHITPLRKFADENGEVAYEDAHDFDNLVTVCASCHGRVEGKYTSCDAEEFISKFE